MARRKPVGKELPPLRDSEPIPDDDVESIDSFAKMFGSLVDDANAEGVDVVTLLFYHDAFTGSQKFHMLRGKSNGYVVRGVLQDALDIMDNGTVLECQDWDDGDAEESNR